VAEQIDDVVRALRSRLDAVPADRERRRHFLGTYLRTTAAIGTAVDGGTFVDGAWLDAWDAAFARRYLDAHDADLAGHTADVARPWRLAFAAPDELPPLRHVLLGINAHVNYDLPQALLAVMSDDELDDGWVVARRRVDHERMDGVLAAQVAEEDAELAAGGRALVDRALAPLNRRGTQRFLREARQKVWHNTTELHLARQEGPEAYVHRLAELELLCAARIADLLAPGQVLLRLAVAGFGVVLPPR
jgi:hypothetical protein